MHAMNLILPIQADECLTYYCERPKYRLQSIARVMCEILNMIYSLW